MEDHYRQEGVRTMRIHKLAATGIATVGAAVLLSLGAGTANAATTTCPGDGPGSTLSAEQHADFDAQMTALKKDRVAIMAKYTTKAKRTPVAGQGQRSAQRARGTQTRLTATQRAQKQAELAAWKVKRDALMTEYGLTARTQGRGA
jgi:hypothetical protein